MRRDRKRRATTASSRCLKEFISPQDGREKQDCEINAAKRWIGHRHASCRSLDPVYVGDDLFAKEPLCRQILDQDADFLFVAKPASHPTLYDYLHGLELPTREVVLNKPGGRSEIRRYKWMNRMPVNAKKDALQVNWLSVEIIRTRDRKVTCRNSFVTSIEVTEDNLERLSESGRCRWRIETRALRCQSRH